MRTRRRTRITLLPRVTMVLLLAATITACGLRGNDGDPSAMLDSALQAHQEGNLDAATKLYTDVIAEDPENVFAWYNLGLIHQTRGDVAGAEDEYRKALAIDPDFVPALFNLAILQTEAGRTSEAISLYRDVISLQPEDASAHLNLGFVLIDSGDEEQGQTELQRAVELDPSLGSRIPAGLAEAVAPPADGDRTDP